MNRKLYHFHESKPSFFEKNNSFQIKNKLVPLIEYTEVNIFCWNVRDPMNIFFGKDLTEKQNMSNKEKEALKFLMKNRNVEICVKWHR